MRYVDRFTDFSNLDVDPEIAAILRATVYNQQLFNDPADDDEATYTTHSVKHASKDKPRADYRPVNDIEEQYEVQYEEILDLLGYSGTALQFQLESWETMNSLETRAQQSGRDQGVVITAPTGFGKTGCFMGYVMHRLFSNLDNDYGTRQNVSGDTAILVYPSRALLHDQLSRVMDILYQRKEAGEEIPTFGIWYGNTPQRRGQAGDTSRSTAEYSRAGTVFTGAQYWDTSAPDSRLFINDDPDGRSSYTLENRGGESLFDSSEFYLGRSQIVDQEPNILLTTLESLENIAMKPHYDLVNRADYFVFDEIHQYSGLRGSHAANVIQNIKRVRNREADGETSPGVFIGSSATIQNPGRFGRRLFGLSIDSAVPNGTEEGYAKEDLQVVAPTETDIDDGNSDKQHYYFMLTPPGDDGPDVASQFLQHGMMLGHSLLEPTAENEKTDRSNILSFIDSKSLLRSLNTKFVDADRHRELYQHHFDHGGEGDWRVLAEETKHVPQSDTPLDEPRLVYSDSEHTIDEIPSHDLTLGTKFLEVGVDIETLGYIINYREPNSVAALKQRAGRAGRSSGDAHMFTLLSSYSGDTNFYYRADGFVDQDISTPLRTENHVVDEIHKWFYHYYCELAAVAEQNDWRHHESAILTRFFEREGWELYDEFLQSPQSVFQNLVDVTVNTDSLLDNSLAQAWNPVENEVKQIKTYFRQFSGALEREADKVFLQQDAVADLLGQFRRKLLKHINTFIELANREGETGLEESLKHFRDEIQSIQFDDPETAAQELNQVISSNFGVVGDVRDLPQQTLDDDPVQSFFDLTQTIKTIEEGATSGKIQRQNTRRRILYYLEQSFKQIREYKNIRFRQGSIYAVKYLLRGAYYFEKALRVDRGNEDADDPTVMGKIWYVPPNYFADTGWYFDLERPNDTSTEKSVDKLLSQYLPFRTEYAAGASERGSADAMNVFQPDVVRNEDGELEFNFSELGEVHNNVLIPDQISLKRVEDISGRGNKIVPYDANTYEILSPNEVTLYDKEEREFGQIYSRPEIATRVNDPTEVSTKRNKHSDLLDLRSVNAQAWVESVSLEITPTKEGYNGPSLDYDAPTIEETIYAGDQRLGYSLNTRALTLSINSLIERFRDSDGRINLDRNRIAQHKALDTIENDRIISVTASHLLTMLVADVTGVNTQVLLYGTDRPTDSTDSDQYKVHTFEQIEGGQGVVDLFWDTLDSRPEKILSSLYRLTRNTQVLNEELWSHDLNTDTPAWDEIITRVGASGLNTETETDSRTDAEQAAVEIIQDRLGFTYPQTINRLQNEMQTTLSQIKQLADDYNVDIHELAELKAEIAKARLVNEDQTNGEELPARIRSEFDHIFSEIDPETIRTVFLSPDVDGCEANLQLKRTIFNVPQSEILSNGVLREIEDWLVDREPVENEMTEMKTRSKLSAHTDDDYAYFLRF
ncbi:DEAD/DEAH box helicase [Haloarchaeobius baliensis]|uniref:DEAD/DEAH box helicase n=1 Tax=Haloarchaeobius baliensis TaxID=1670458 RepID=UPI003F885F65